MTDAAWDMANNDRGGRFSHKRLRFYVYDGDVYMPLAFEDNEDDYKYSGFNASGARLQTPHQHHAWHVEHDGHDSNNPSNQEDTDRDESGASFVR